MLCCDNSIHQLEGKYCCSSADVVDMMALTMTCGCCSNTQTHVALYRCRSLPRSSLFWESAVRRLPAVLEERQSSYSVLQGLDKAFACVRRPVVACACEHTSTGRILDTDEA